MYKLTTLRVILTVLKTETTGISPVTTTVCICMVKHRLSIILTFRITDRYRTY